MVQLFSVGHSNVSTARFLDLLAQHHIAAVCDVRSAPYSRYNPHFNRETLAADLRAAGSHYQFMGAALGGIPTDPNLRSDDGSHADHDRIRASAAFQDGIEQLLALGADQPTAFMCGEADYHGCHRNLLITPALIERGASVWHILPDGRLERGGIAPIQHSLF